MAEILTDFLLKILGENNYLVVLFVSMFPLIELKGAIPIGSSLGLQFYQSAPLAYLGSTLICIPIFFLLKPFFNLLKKISFIRKLVEKIEAVFYNKAQKIAKKADQSAEDKIRKIYILSLFIFVAVPFPVTGVWTGTAIAVFLNMKFKDSILPLALGNLVAGVLITILTLIFRQYVDYIIYGLFAIALIMLIVFIVKVFTAKTPQSQQLQPDESESSVVENQENNE